MSSDPRAQALRALSGFLLADVSMGETLLRVAEITTSAMPTTAMAGVTLLDEHGRPETAVFTDSAAPEIDTGQYDSGRGPCLDAWRQKRVVRIERMEEARSSYPEFVMAATAHGVESTLSLPLVAGDRGIGALNLYARVPSGYSADDEDLAIDLAATAAIVLANATAYWEASALSEQLEEAMRSRAVIEQAKGMLMAQSPSLGPDDAFDLLRRASQRENIKLRDIAQRIVLRRGDASLDG